MNDTVYVEIPPTDFDCPKCGHTHNYYDWGEAYERKGNRSGEWIQDFHCKRCKAALQITTDMTGAVHVWNKPTKQ